MAESYSHEKVVQSAEYLKNLITSAPEFGIICGSGLSGLGEDVVNRITVDYKEIPHFANSTVSGHHGQLVFGKLGGKNVICMLGRFHSYEGYQAWKIALPVRVMKLLGVKTIIITSAAGGRSSFNVGDFMLIKDHISFPGLGGYNPLRGPNDDKFGPRFPPVTPAYDKDLKKLLHETAAHLGYGDITKEGVYCQIAGPNYNTVAELNFLQKVGIDAVGMSVAQEVVAAAHCGLKVVACALITDVFDLDPDCSAPVLSHEQVLKAANERADDMKKLITEFLERFQ